MNRISLICQAMSFFLMKDVRFECHSDYENRKNFKWKFYYNDKEDSIVIASGNNKDEFHEFAATYIEQVNELRNALNDTNDY